MTTATEPSRFKSNAGYGFLGFGVFLLVAGIFIFMNFVMDIMYAWLDPRIRYR